MDLNETGPTCISFARAIDESRVENLLLNRIEGYDVLLYIDKIYIYIYRFIFNIIINLKL